MNQMCEIIEYLEKRQPRTTEIENVISAARSLENWLKAPQDDKANREIVLDCRSELRVAVDRLERLK